MKRLLLNLTVFTLFTFGLTFQTYSQCIAPGTQSGGTCTRSTTFDAEYLPNNGCGVYTVINNYSPGTWFRVPVLPGACYTVSTCGAPINTQIGVFQGIATVTGPYAWNDDNGPECATTAASVEFVPNFNDYVGVDVREFNCSAVGSSSITVNLRQNNNLMITSASTGMCAGETRTLTATPSPVTPFTVNAGDGGTFTGTGVSGTTFTAPTPAGASQVFTITYTYGYCSTTQDITVYANPSTAMAGPDQTICGGTATLAANAPTIGTGVWSVVSGPGSVTTPTNPNSGVTGLIAGSPTTFRWTVSNGTCTASTDDVIITRDPDPTPANAGPDQNIECLTTATLAGNTPSSGTGVWTLVGGTGTVTTPADPNSGVTGLTFGASSTFRWTISTGGVCPVSTDDVVITVGDATPPTAACQNLTVYLNGSGNASITSGDVDNGSSDNCGIASLSLSQSAFTCADVGANTVTLTVTDVGGNTANCNSTVTILDTTSPSAVCQNLTVYLNGSGNASITTGDVDNGSTDNCSISSLALSQSSFTCADIGANNVVLTATDGSGNTSACTSTVTILDTASPSAVCQNITAYLDGTGNVTITAADVDGGSMDNCGTPSLSISQSAFTCANIGANSVILTATDGSGNTSACTATVTILDTVSPSAVCQNITLYLNGSGNGTITAGDIDNGSTDNCSVASISASPTSFTCANTGANNVTLTVTDASGNTSTCTSTVTVLDTVSPSAVCQNLTVYLGGSGSASITTGDVDNGSTDNCSISSLALSQSSFTCADIGANNVTLTVTDGSGNTDACTSTVTILDTASPSAVCQNITAYLDGTGNVTITAADVDGGSTDNCGTPSLSISQSAFTCANIGANSVILTATDGSGNTSACTAIVTILDTVSPSAVCQNLTVYLNGSGNATITAGDIDNGSTDNCSVASISASPTSFTCANTGANNVTLTVTDASGNTSTCTSTVTVLDTTSPSAVCQNITVYLDGTGSATITTGDVDNGSSDNCSLASLALSQSSFACTDIGANNVTLTVTDASGNTDACTSTVTILDTTSPSAVCQNITAYLDGTGNVTVTAADVDGGSTDNCGTPSLAISQSAFTCANIGANSVILTATDGSGNTSACTATVTILDTASPSAVCQNLTVYLNGSGNATITAGDIDNGSTDNCSVASISASPTSFTCANTGANNVTLTVTDASGNTSTCTAVVTVLDTTSPSAVCQNITVYLNGTGNASITGTDVDGGSTDNCSVASLAASPNAFTCANIGANTVTLTVTDGSGNTDACSSTVTILDTTSPNAVCQNITAYLDGTGNVTITAADVDGGSIDNCGTPSLSISQSAFTCANIGANSVVLTATDGSGNTSACTATVTILDTVSPNAVCQNVTLYLDGSGNGTITAGDVDGGSTDNCSVASISASPTSFTCANTGANNVTLTVTDASGNTSTCTAVVTVLDTTSPSAVCQNITVYLDGTGNTSITGADVDSGSTDNCSVASLSASPSSFTCTNIGVNNVTLTVTDASGNTDACTATVTVLDTISPTITCPGNQTEFADASCEVSIPDYTALATASDNCTAAPTVTQFPTAGTTISGAGTVTTITLTATDGSGNTSTCSFTMTVSDTVSPTITCPANQTVFADASCQVPLLDYTGMGTATDNCDAAPVITQSPLAGTTLSGAGMVQTVTLTATDASGNTSTCTFDVTVSDTTSPTITCPVDQTVFADASCQVSLPDYTGMGTAVDNCDAAPVITQSPAAGTTLSGAGTVQVVMLTATDASGNTSMCTFNVTVSDTVSPTITCPANQTVIANTSCQVSLPDYTGMGIAADNCDASPTITQSPAAGTIISGAGTVQTVTLTATDASGNNSSCTFDVTILDTLDPIPTIASLPDVTAQCTSAPSPPTASDNCSGTLVGTTTTSFPITTQGTTVVTWTYTDGSGNTATQTQNVVIDDTTAPTIPTLSDITAECIATATPPTTTDNCVGTVIGTTSDPVTYNVEGTYLITWTFDDGNGNISAATQNVIIDDVTDPVTPTLTDVTGECTATATPPTTTDNCAGTLVGTTTDPLTYNTQGTFTINWTFDDGNGNSITVPQTVIVDDVTAPSVPGLADITGNCSVTVTVPTATDNCVGAVMGTTTDPLTYDADGTYVVNWTFDDGNGNSVTVPQNVIVNGTATTSSISETACDTFVAPSGAIYTAPGLYSDTITNAAGCDSIISISLTMNYSTTTILTVVGCGSYTSGSGMTYTSSGTYTENLFTTAGCDSTVTLNVTIENLDVSVTQNGVNLTANWAGASSYQWIDCSDNSPIAGATGQTYVAAANGSYAVIVTSPNCEDTSDCYTVTTVGIEDLGDLANDIVIYPNPTNDGHFTVQYEGVLKSVQLIDMLGRFVDTPVDLETGAVDGSTLEQGKYTLRIKTEYGAAIKTVVIVR